MAVVNGQGTTFNLPNFVGELFGLTPTETPFLAAIGGLTGGKKANAPKFQIQTYDLPNAENPNHLEGQDAPPATEVNRQNIENVVQIFHESINVSYSKQASVGQIGGASILGDQPVGDELAWQTMRKLEKMARDIEFAFINGTFVEGTAATARKTRGILSSIATNVVTAPDSDGAVAGLQPSPLSEAVMEALFRQMYDNGAMLGAQTVLMVNSAQKMALTDIYRPAAKEAVPDDRNFGGVNLQRLETDFGTFGVMLDRHMPQDQVAVVDLSVCAPALLEIPDEEEGGSKGFLFREKLAKTGASMKYQIYGECGLQHGPETMHGKVLNLAA